MKKLLTITFLFIASIAFSQAFVKGTGIRYDRGVPTVLPDTLYGTEFIIDIENRTVYMYDRVNEAFVKQLNMTRAAGVPSGDPGDGPELYENISTGDLYWWKVSSWEQLNGGGGVTDGDKGSILVSGVGSIWTIDNLAVDQAQLANGAVTTVKIANDAVDQTKILDGQVTPSEIENTAVTPGTYINPTVTVDEDGRITNASNGESIAGALADSMAVIRNYIQNIIEYDAGNGAIVWATDPGVTFARTSSTEGTFSIPDSVMLVSGVIHNTSAQNPGTVYYLRFNFAGTRVSNNDLLDINPPKSVRVLNKFAATLSGVVNRTTPIDYSKTINSPNLDLKVSGLSPLEIQLNNYNDANVGGSNDTIIIFSF